ncbi:MAG: nitroreductase family protein [Oscillospiraceae bacterium]|nr:nitroreductase family protein [Oscillospiraceae bacterium]
MNTLETIAKRRSIRKYLDRQVSREDLQKILEAGLCAPNAGGGQRSVICAIQNRELCAKLGRLNGKSMDRRRLTGSFVSAEQPSLIDDPSIQSGFYGAPTVCAIFAPSNFLYSVPDAFCCAENMALAACELGVSSCIVARAEETFENEWGKDLMKQWEIPDGYLPRCFVLLGYVKGDYPPPKPRKAGRSRIIE